MGSGMRSGPVIATLAEVGTALKLLSEHRLGAEFERLLQSELEFVLQSVHRLKVKPIMQLWSGLEFVLPPSC